MHEKGSTITPEQVQEFRNSFEHFDQNHNEYLEKYELKACLSSLDQELTDDELTALVSKISKNGTTVSFDEFCDYLVKKLADQDSPEQIKEAFRTIAGSKDFVTENDLLTVLPPDDVKFLSGTMPKNANGLDYNAFTDQVYQ